MARPEKRKARKDYPNDGIVKGDEYYYVKIKTGPRSSRVMRQKTPFRRSQLTQSEYLSALYDWEDNTQQSIASPDDCESAAEDLRQIGQEQQEKLDNMPDGLQSGDTGQMLQERADACEAAADELDDIATRWRDAMDEAADENRDFEDGDYIDEAQGVSVG